jgi:CheY-like chemotaxis protein
MGVEQADSPFRLPALANVRPLRPIRVLLAGRDPRYLRVMAFLLGRRGYEIQRVTKDAALLEDVGSFDPDVVVLVEGDSFGDTVGQAVALLGTTERASVVVATARHEAPAANRLRFVQKWGPFDSLVDAVERAWAEIPPALHPERSVN